ncbi:Centromere/kinetochore Zw10 [Teladorsagia circumcincta]|uniref:Centromere/kinetochore Zw10 n=1 Tax=Teladorsagia circumcincta TaxID=45464 RepID=A0A2G9UM85_TELCI|nr:Centromere/kinetochore Zw10 [Teladorsagia circumcincta]
MKANENLSAPGYFGMRRVSDFYPDLIISRLVDRAVQLFAPYKVPGLNRMISELDALEKDIACGLEKVVEGLHERYVEFQPVLKVAEEDIVLKLEDLSNAVNEKLQLADSFLRENSMDSSGEQKPRMTLTAQDRLLRKKLSDLSDCRQLLDKVQNIEGLLISCRSNSLSKIHEARNLLECEALLNDITQDDGWPILTGRVRDILRDEVSFMMKSLVYVLTCSFDEFVSYPSTDVKGTVHMHIRNNDSKDVSEMLAALSLLGELDKRVKKWATYIVKNFVQPIVDSGNGVDPYERFTISNDTYEFTASSKVRPTVQGISVEGIVSGLKRFFSHLASSINEIALNNRPLSLCLGGFFQEELMTVFLKQCVAASIPVQDSDGSKLKHAMEIAEQFRKDMIELGFFNDATPTFQAFSEQHFTVFIDRRCLEVIKRAKELICMPYLELAEVGNGDEVSEETILQYKEAFGKMMPKSVTTSDSLYPLLLQLPRCKVSQSTVDLMELLFSTLNDAVTTDNEKLSARLTLTARNVVQLFELTAPRHHGTAISSMPQMAAIFYNNCYYICHRLMLMPFSVLKGVNKQSEKTIRQCRRDISVMLAKDDCMLFTYNNLFLYKVQGCMQYACGGETSRARN